MRAFGFAYGAGDAQADAMGGLIESCEVQIGNTPGGERLVMVGLTIFPDESSGDRFLQYARQVAADLGVGIRQIKTVEAFGQQVPVSSLMVRRGRLMIELTLSNVEQSAAEADALARALFATALYEN